MIVALVQPLFADITQIVFGIVALIFLVIRQLLEANKQAGPQRVRPPVPPPAPQPQPLGKGVVPAAGQQADPLRAQVEEFLRRAGRPPQPEPQRPVQLPPKPAPARESDSTGVTDKRTFGQPLRQAEWRDTPATSAPTQLPRLVDKPKPSRSPAKPRRRQSVAEHVAEQVSAHARELAAKASQLGQRIASEDQQFDVQLRAKFDHTLGTLAGGPVPAAAEPASSGPLPSDTPAAQIAALLANPTGIRQAVLINEILRRPSERW